jgi:hypothetical protein
MPLKSHKIKQENYQEEPMNIGISKNALASPEGLHKDYSFAGFENQLNTGIFKEPYGDFEHLYIFSLFPSPMS